jgi:hypothetical protein
LLPLATIATMALAGAGCGASPHGDAAGTLPPVVFVGNLASSDAVVGLELGDAGWVFYACGGATSLASLTHWFSASPAADAIEFTREGWVLQGQSDGLTSGWRGTLTGPDGVARAWAAAPSPPGTLSGLYSVVEDGCRTGLVVSQAAPGAAVHAQGTWCNGAGRFEQVTPILPVERTDLGIRVEVNAPGATRDLYLAPVSVPLQ